jgi:hypothetical protein
MGGETTKHKATKRIGGDREDSVRPRFAEVFNHIVGWIGDGT